MKFDQLSATHPKSPGVFGLTWKVVQTDALPITCQGSARCIEFLWVNDIPIKDPWDER